MSIPSISKPALTFVDTVEISINADAVNENSDEDILAFVLSVDETVASTEFTLDLLKSLVDGMLAEDFEGHERALKLLITKLERLVAEIENDVEEVE